MPVEAAHDPAPRFWPLFAIALAVRLGIVLLGVGLAAARPGSRPTAETAVWLYSEIDPVAAGPIEPWYRADALWLVHVGTRGYAGAVSPDGQSGAAFLPAMPGVLAAAHALGLNLYWVGLLATNLASALGLAFFTQLAARLTANRVVGVRTFVLLNAFPSAFFLSAPYQEGFGLLFTALALSAWFSGRIGPSALFAGVGCLARVTGVVLGAAALGAWLVEQPRTRARLQHALVLTAGCALGVLAGFAVMWATVGDPFATLKAHESWGRRSASVWNFVHAVRSIYDPAAPRVLEGGLAILFTFLGVRAWRTRGAFWGLVTLLPIAQMAATGTFLSGHRLLLAALPAFIELADLLRNRLAFATVVTLSAVVQLMLLNTYIHWGFAG